MPGGEACLSPTPQTHAWSGAAGQQFVLQFALGSAANAFIERDGRCYVSLTFMLPHVVERVTATGVEVQRLSAGGVATNIGGHVGASVGDAIMGDATGESEMELALELPLTSSHLAGDAVLELQGHRASTTPMPSVSCEGPEERAARLRRLQTPPSPPPRPPPPAPPAPFPPSRLPSPSPLPPPPHNEDPSHEHESTSTAIGADELDMVQTETDAAADEPQPPNRDDEMELEMEFTSINLLAGVLLIALLGALGWCVVRARRLMRAKFVARTDTDAEEAAPVLRAARRKRAVISAARAENEVPPKAKAKRPVKKKGTARREDVREIQTAKAKLLS